MKYIIAFLLVCGSLVVVSGQRNAGLSWGGPIDSLHAELTVYEYDLQLNIDLESKRIEGRVGVRYSQPEGQKTLRLHIGPWFEVDGVESGGRTLNFERSEGFLDIDIISDSAWVYVDYEGVPLEAKYPPWSGGFSWEKDEKGNHWQGLSSQGAGGILFMPCVNHPARRAMEGVQQAITVPRPYVVAANGLLREVETQGKQVTYYWESDYPISTYNINFTTGRFERESRPFISLSGDTIPMVIYLLESDVDRMDELFQVLQQSLETQESFFGPFPFAEEKVGIVQTSYLGMEHQTINAYGNDFRFDTLNGVVFDWLLHHELGHEWWGNKLSVGDWADFWLHEGFCTYGDWLAREAYGGKELYSAHTKNMKEGIPFLRPIVPESPATSAQAYHREVYFKGAFVLHSLRWILGDTAFFRMLHSIAGKAEFSYENQWSTPDFIEEVANYTHYDLKEILDIYLYTTNPLSVKLTKWPEGLYSVRWENLHTPIPLEIEMDGELHTLELSDKDIFFSVDTPPKIDPRGWYLLEVISD